jgi:hypothetical protein
MLKLLMGVAISVVKDVIKWKMGKEIISVYSSSPYIWKRYEIQSSSPLLIDRRRIQKRWYLGGYWDLSL